MIGYLTPSRRDGPGVFCKKSEKNFVKHLQLQIMFVSLHQKQTKTMEQNVNTTYTEGIQLINRLASLEYNANNDCPDFDIREYGKTFSRACDFIIWCKENGKAADLRYYLSSKCSKGCPGNEWESLRETFKMRGLEI